MAPVSKLLLGGVALATLQGCGGPNKVTNLDTKVDIPVNPPIAPVDDENDDAGVQSNHAQIVVEDENIGEISDANVSGQVMESDEKKTSRYVEDLQKKTQQIWNAVMSKKGGAIAAGVALTGTLATAIGYKVKQHRAQAGRTCTAVGEGVSAKFVGVRYYDGQKVNFECATGYTLTDDEVTVECDANGEARITACSKNSSTIWGYPLRKIVTPVLAFGVVGFAACLIFRHYTDTLEKLQPEIIDLFVKPPKEKSYKATDVAIKDYVNKHFGNVLATLVGVDLKQDSSAKNIDILCEGLAVYVNEKIAEKLQQEIIDLFVKPPKKATDEAIKAYVDEHFGNSLATLVGVDLMATIVGVDLKQDSSAKKKEELFNGLAAYVDEKIAKKLEIIELFVKLPKEKSYEATDDAIKDYVNKHFDNFLATLVGVHLKQDSSAKYKDALFKGLAAYVNEKIAEKLQQEIIDQLPPKEKSYEATDDAIKEFVNKHFGNFLATLVGVHLKQDISDDKDAGENKDALFKGLAAYVNLKIAEYSCVNKKKTTTNPATPASTADQNSNGPEQEPKQGEPTNPASEQDPSASATKSGKSDGDLPAI